MNNQSEKNNFYIWWSLTVNIWKGTKIEISDSLKEILNIAGLMCKVAIMGWTEEELIQTYLIIKHTLKFEQNNLSGHVLTFMVAFSSIMHSTNNVEWNVDQNGNVHFTIHKGVVSILHSHLKKQNNYTFAIWLSCAAECICSFGMYKYQTFTKI